MGRRRIDPVKRLIDKTEFNDCWTWQGTFTKQGYGLLWIVDKYVIVHRYAFETFVEPLVPGLVLRHTCDIENCWNFDHLIQGTQKENIADASRQGNMKGGNNAKLSSDQIRIIKKLVDKGFGYDTLAKDFDVSIATISNAYRSNP